MSIRTVPALAPAWRSRDLDGLTAREREVTRLVARGLSNEEIGGALHISPLTAKTHVSRILMKTRCRDRSQLVILAYETGLVRVRDAGPVTADRSGPVRPAKNREIGTFPPAR